MLDLSARLFVRPSIRMYVRPSIYPPSLEKASERFREPSAFSPQWPSSSRRASGSLRRHKKGDRGCEGLREPQRGFARIQRARRTDRQMEITHFVLQDIILKRPLPCFKSMKSIIALQGKGIADHYIGVASSRPKINLTLATIRCKRGSRVEEEKEDCGRWAAGAVDTDNKLRYSLLSLCLIE